MKPTMINPQISILGAFLVLILFEWGLIQGEGLFEGAYELTWHMLQIKLVVSTPFL